MQDERAGTRKMEEVEAVIADRRNVIAATAFIRALDRASTVEEIRAFTPHLTFYVLAFQDVLRLVDKLIRDPELSRIAHRHREEDAGHEGWFLFDVAALGCERDLAWTFGEAHELTRDVSYQLIAEVLMAQDDRERLVMPLVLEAIGAEFFGRVIGALERARFEKPLRYFARHHQNVEADHEIFTDAAHADLSAIAFDEATFARSVAMVHRAFDAMERLAAHLHAHMKRGREASG